MEDILKPGYVLIYDGSKASTGTSFTVSYPNIKPSQGYRFKVKTKNCGVGEMGLSTGSEISTKSGSVPDVLENAPMIKEYVDATNLKVSFNPPAKSGGYPITSF